MKPKTYEILARAVEEGVKYGYMRAHKHNESPDEHDMTASVETAVMNAICEVFSFEDECT